MANFEFSEGEKLNMEISIIIPTHNRYSLLLRTLEALSRQTEDPRNYEVIVVADGCQDNTVDAVKKLSTPYRLSVIEQPQSGPGAARNNGAKAASSPILLFLDDDLEPEPEFVKAHLDAHKKWPGEVILGYSPPVSDESDQNNFAYINDTIWWSNLFAEQAKNTHRFNVWDLTTANISIFRILFEELGGFDEEFPTSICEDSELGIRLIKRHIRFRFVQEAAAKHHARRSAKTYYQRMLNLGRAHVIILRKHPEVLPIIPFAYIIIDREYIKDLTFFFTPNRILFKLLWLNPAIGRALAWGFQLLLSFAQICKYYKLYNNILLKFYGYQYWRGVQAELVSYASAIQLAKEALDAPVHFNEIDIDLKNDFNRIDEILDQHPADAVSLYYGGLLIGRIEPEIGAEALRPKHIYANLIKQESICNSLIQVIQSDKELASQILLFLDLLSNTSKRELSFFQGWHGIEKWDGIDTRWMKKEAHLLIVWDEKCKVDLNLRVSSFYRARTLELYVNNLFAGKWTVPKEPIEISIQTPLSKGLNLIKLNVPEGCEKPRDHWRLRLLNSDSRCLSIAVQILSLRGLSARTSLELETSAIPPVVSLAV